MPPFGMGSGAMTTRISQVMSDPRDPEEILRALSAQELRSLTDALYRTLDTPSPAPGIETWYELAVEEDIRRFAADLTASAGGPGEQNDQHDGEPVVAEDKVRGDAGPASADPGVAGSSPVDRSRTSGWKS